MMKDLSIDLGENGPEAMPTPSGDGKVFYPSLHISSDEEIDLPKSGKMTVSYRVTRTEESEGKGTTRYSLTLEVLSIVGVEEGKKETKRPDDEFEERMDAHMKSKQGKEDEED